MRQPGPRSTEQLATLRTLISSDLPRIDALEAVAALALPDCWIGAGFVRDAVWDHLHGYQKCLPVGDVDVVWFSPAMPNEDIDRDIEHQLQSRVPGLAWSVKNQARMHLRNGDAPYKSVADAMRHWPETATAVAARLGANGSVEINAPLGVDDLFALRLRPTQAFVIDKWPIFQERVSSKRWVERDPLLAVLRQ